MSLNGRRLVHHLMANGGPEEIFAMINDRAISKEAMGRAREWLGNNLDDLDGGHHGKKGAGKWKEGKRGKG